MMMMIITVITDDDKLYAIQILLVL